MADRARVLDKLTEESDKSWTSYQERLGGCYTQSKLLDMAAGMLANRSAVLSGSALNGRSLVAASVCAQSRKKQVQYAVDVSGCFYKTLLVWGSR